MSTEYLDRIPDGWYVRDVMRKSSRGWDWCALVIDCDPEDQEWHRMTRRKMQSGFYLIPGKYRNYDAAYEALEALEALLATKH